LLILNYNENAISEIQTWHQAASCGMQSVEGNPVPSTASHCLSH